MPAPRSASISSAQLRLRFPDPVKAVIFDMDGTLLDTEAMHNRASADAAAALGWPLPPEVLNAMVGIHREGNQRMLADHFGPDFPLEQYFRDTDILFEARADAGIPLRPGADTLLAHLAQAGVPMALATSTRSPLAQKRLSKTGLFSYFDAIVTRNDVAFPKPHPEPYLLAAHRLGIDPASIVAVEDSYAGTRSAIAAGMTTVMVPDLMPPIDELVSAGAIILPSLTDLLPLIGATLPQVASNDRAVA
jgi:HAD superfamily hydrolase (TIGR01509 family)